jgi:glycerol-3-phosphate dehydrogenase
MQKLSADLRSANLRTMKEQVFDLVVIGGGITGAGVARDAASRGLKVALIEARDFAIGTSSRSSKLVHGGIRYLEQKEFALVFEALSERQHLFEIAPHLVHPLRFVIPLYKSGRVGMFMMGLGMWLYDVLSLFDAPELHSKLNPDDVHEQFPILNNKDLLGAYAYSDAYMDDDRLVFETMRSAVHHGAVCANYTKAIGAEFIDGKMSSIQCQDEISQSRFTIQGKHFVSTVGPWTDELGEKLLDKWKKLLRPSKGVHLTFDRARLPLKDAIVMGAEERIVFGIPRNDMVIVGTTDTDFPQDPAEVRTNKEDVTYLLKVTNQYFPGAHITESDIVSVYAGVRPLVDDSSQTESKTSREHLILNDPRNITFVAGGKYTTYRLMAEQAVDAAIKNWDLSDRAKYAKGQTLNPLNPKVTPALYESAKANKQAWARRFQIPFEVMNDLVERHGQEALDICERYLDQIKPHSTSIAALTYGLEALHAIDHTMCLSLRDFIFRRTHLFLADREHGKNVWEFLSKIMANRLGWTESQRVEQINALQNQISFELHWQH